MISTIKYIRIFLIYFNLKTIYFNFHYLPIRKAIHFPIFLSRNTKLKCTRGTIEIACPIKTGMIRIGTHEIGIYDKRHNRPVWEQRGIVIFHGYALIKYGAKVIVGKNGKLELGDHTRLSSGSFIICYKSVILGDNCHVSWETQIIDTDFHQIYNDKNDLINPDKEIRIGTNCWIGNRCSIYKGTHLRDMVVVASNSLVNTDYPESNVILAGVPARIVKTAISWSDNDIKFKSIT